MSVKWLIVQLGHDEDIHGLYYGVREAGYDAEVVSMKDYYESLENPSDERACVVPKGSIWTNSFTRQNRPNWVGLWHNKATYLCTRYYGHLGSYISQKNYAMLPLGEVLRRKDWLYQTFGVDGSVFIRPDSGEKEFTGEVVAVERFDAWRDVHVENLPRELLCVVSSPIKIHKELRLVIAEKKVVSGSTYRIIGHILREPLEEQEDKDKIIAYAEDVLTKCDFAPVHVLDVAVDDNGECSIMEVGCFCCAGLYSSDKRKIAKAVSEVAEKEFANAVPLQTEAVAHPEP